MTAKYKMTISRLTVDKLGVKLYDRVSAVIAELVANCYDADATEVVIEAPMGEMLASRSGGVIQDKGLSIEVRDNGSGMTPDEMNAFYLIVGAERRNDARRGDLSKKFKRKVMGRKGVGKLAPFGVCKKVEIISSGGKKTTGSDQNGNSKRGYLTAHLFLDRTKILQDTDMVYHPEPGELDGLISQQTGTVIRLSGFDYRQVPPMDVFERQLSQRFGVSTPDWTITLIDSLKDADSPDRTRSVGEFEVSTMEHTMVRFEEPKATKKGTQYHVIGPDGHAIMDMQAGFEHEGTFYPVTGWVAYSKRPYADDLMAGVRVYCRGKIAAQTHIFNMKAGFTGEYDIRSYLVGELHADWLDEEEDLIRTDRQDILWSHSLGSAFEKWGQAIVKRIGAATREPTRKQAWESFLELSDYKKRVGDAFPRADQSTIRENATEIAKAIARTTRADELQIPETVQAITSLSLLLGPHITLDEQLRQAADKDDSLSAITGILRTARIAELSSFGNIADKRVKVIHRIEMLKDDPSTLESAFQNLLQETPWLIDPQWSPVIANQSFNTLKKEFEKFYKKKTGDDINLDPVSDHKKRMDFVLSSQDNILQIIEIKKPGHALVNTEMERINTYDEQMREFLSLPGNQPLLSLFTSFHITLVCDGISLSGVHKAAFDGLVSKGRLTHINWTAFLLRTRKMHEDFLKEAVRQQDVANQS